MDPKHVNPSTLEPTNPSHLVILKENFKHVVTTMAQSFKVFVIVAI
jgi:hypothetical protein